MREPPAGYSDIEPSNLTDEELRRVHVEMGEWVEQALSQDASCAPDDDLYSAVYGKLSEISAERAMRQREDRGAADAGRY